MTRDELLGLIIDLQSFDTELDDVEAKSANKGAPKVYDSLSALSNRPGGGVIVFGLDEEHSFQPVGVYDLNDLRKKLGEAASQMVPPCRLTFTHTLYEGKVILAAEVPECPPDQKPCYYGPKGMHGGSYIRVADGDRKMTDYEIHSFVSARRQAEEDRQPVEAATLGDLDKALVDDYVERLRAKAPGARYLKFPKDELLKTLNIVTLSAGVLKPTLAGLLMFGRFPQQFFPSLMATFLLFPSTKPEEKGPGGERWLDNRRFDGTIPQMIEALENAILASMRRSTVVSGFARQDVLEYPPETVREAVRNAFVHRDYSRWVLGSQIQIRMFPDRLEVESPGGLYGPISEDTIGLTGPTTRNAVLMRMMEDLELVENRGSGIRTMIEAMRRAHLSPPGFRDTRSSFTVTLRNHTLLDESALQWLNKFKDIALNDEQRFALVYLKRNHRMSNRDYQRINVVDAVRATRDLQDMRQRASVIRQHGTRGGAYYTLSEWVLDEGQETIAFAPTLTGDEQRILDFVKTHGSITNPECRELLGIVSLHRAGYLLSRMEKKGVLEQQGSGRWAKYVLRPAWEQDLSPGTSRS